MNTTREKHPDGTIELTITIPWTEIAATKTQVVKDTVKTSQVPGFRKGKAPKKLIEDQIDTGKVYEEVIRRILPKVYSDAVTQQGIKPILTPKIELKEAHEKSDWIVRCLTCEKPQVTLKAYKQAISDLKAGKQKQIWVPGKGTKPEDEEKAKKPTIDEILKMVFDNISVTLPSLLIEREVNRLLSDLLDQTKKLGLSVEQYLASTGKTADSIRHEYEDHAKRTISLEFALEEIADAEGVFVSDDDITAVIKTAKTDEERNGLEKERYYLASVLRRQKTLDFLASL